MGTDVKGKAWNSNRANFDRNLAVVIGIDLYENSSIRNLSTAVSDASAIADLLEQQYAYKHSDEKPEVIRLFDEEATLDALKHLFHTRIPEELNPGEGDRLIIYYAGHGLPRSNEDGPEGYLVPYDADPTKPELFLAMRDVSAALSKLKCHHLLVILDCCFAGTFRWAGSRKAVPILETIRREHYYHFIRHPAWQVITSSAHDQEALDVARLKEDNRKPVPGLDTPHSPFALAILEGLQTGDDPKRVNADLYPDGVVTAHELFVYLQNRVKELSGERQTPGIFPLRQDYDKGEFIFTRPEFDPQKLAEALPLNEDNNPYRGLNSFDEKHAAFFFGRQALIDELAKRLSKPDQALTVVLGVSGSGKSSLVKAGLLPHLRNPKSEKQAEQQPQQWYILNPMRPGELPFISLGRTLLPVVKAELLEQVGQVSFLDKFFEPMLKATTEAKQNSVSVAQDQQEQADETLMKVADSWCSATPETKLLLIEDYFAQLETLGNPQQQEQLKTLHKQLLAELDAVSKNLQQDPHYLSRSIATWSQNHPGIRLLLVIDQFEELLTRSQDDRESPNQTEQQDGNRTTKQKEWQKFLEILRIAIAEHAQTLRLVLTLRSDFEPRFLTSALKPYWKDARFPVRAMTSDELRQAIENPALKQALYFEESKDGNLVSKLVDEVGQMPGALPLLSFTLSELYISLYRRWQDDRSTDRTLRFKDYEALGGVAGALTRRATQEYEALDENHRATMQRVILRMVAIEGGGVARRQVPEPELVYLNSEENKRVEQVVDRLVKARLLVKGQETGEPYVEPAHDFLIRGWDKLQEWVKNRQSEVTLQQRLTPAVKDWHRNNQESEYLWVRDPRLAVLEKVLESKTDNWLNQLEIEFVEKSKQRRVDELEETKQQLRISEERRLNAELREKASRVGNLTTIQPHAALELALEAVGENLEMLPNELLNSVKICLHTAMRKCRVSKSIQGHESYMNSVASSPNMQLVASGSNDKTVRLWDLQGNPVGAPFQGHESGVSSVAFSPDGKLIASGSNDKTVRLWDLQGNPVGAPFQGHESGVSSVAFSPDGKLIASGSNDKTVRLWDLQGNPVEAPFQGHESGVSSVAFSPDGKLIASGSNDKTVRLWDLQGNPVEAPFQGHESGVSSVAFSPDGKLIASGSHSDVGNIGGNLRLWNTNGQLLRPPIQVRGELVVQVAFSPDNRLLACASGYDTNPQLGSSVQIWDLQGNFIGSPLRHQSTAIMAVVFSSDSQIIISGDEEGRLYFWDLREDLIRQFYQDTNTTVMSLKFSPDGKFLASGSGGFGGDDMTVRLWDFQGNCISQPIQANNSGVFSIAFSPNSHLVAIGYGDGTIVLWNLISSCIEQSWKGGEGGIHSVTFHPSGHIIASGGGDCNINLWDLQGNPINKSFQGHENAVFSVEFSPDGKLIASGSWDKTIRLWDLQGNCIGDPFRGHLFDVMEVAFSPDGQTIASISEDGTLRLWNLQGNEVTPPLRGHEGYAYSVAFSPDGQLLATGCLDGSVCLWNLQNGARIEQICTFSGSDVRSARSVTFSLDGKLIASGGNNGICLWRGSWQEWLKVCCDRLDHRPNFTNPELVENGDQDKIALIAYKTCEKYVWSKMDSSVE